MSGNRFADSIIVAADEGPEAVAARIAELERAHADMPAAFLVRLSQRLAGQDVALAPLADWLQATLGAARRRPCAAHAWQRTSSRRPTRSRSPTRSRASASSTASSGGSSSRTRASWSTSSGGSGRRVPAHGLHRAATATGTRSRASPRRCAHTEIGGRRGGHEPCASRRCAATPQTACAATSATTS